MADFNKAPYYDDFDENKKFLQVLFQPGRPVQSRELTQLQSILQNQVERAGSHIFKQGSKVFDVEVSDGKQGYDSETIQYIKLAPRDRNGNIIDVSNFIGKTITVPGRPDGTTGTGKVLAGTSNTGGDPDTIFVRWHPTGGMAALQENDVLQTEASSGVYYTANVSDLEIEPTGHGSVFETTDGIYFVNGRYVKADAQTVVVSKYNRNGTYRIGFDIIDNFVSSSDDESLLDPASGFSNYTGSGADRYKVDLILTTKGDGVTISQLQASSTISTEIGEIAASNTFFEIARIVDGRLTRQVKTPLYAEIENMLARKFYDLSGNFTVSGHKALLQEKALGGEGGLDGSDEFLFGIEGGKSYVYGFEWDNTGKVVWTSIPKARDTVTTPENHRVPILYNNYIRVHDSINAISNGINTNDIPAKGFFHVNEQPRVSLFSQNRFLTDSNLGANNTDLTARDGTGLLSANVYNSILVGTARAEAFQYDSAATSSAGNFGIQGKSYRLYLRDFAPNKIQGTSNGTNQSSVLGVYYNNSDGISYYKLETIFHGKHGFSNVAVIASQNSMYGADFVTVHGFNTDEGYWNITRGEVVDANNEWIGVKSIRSDTVNNYGASVDLNTIGDGFITRTTRGGISPRRLILLDENSRALWSDAYNGATIRINGETRTIVDYVGGAHVNSISFYQGAEDGGVTYSNGNNLDGVGKRGLAIVNREFSAIPDRSTQYTINFSLKNARSVGINANTEANGHATADLAYWKSRGIAAGTPGLYNYLSQGASPDLSTLYNIDVVSGVTPVGSIEDNNNADEIYGISRVAGDTLMGGSLGTLLGGTARGAVKTLKTHGSGDTASSNTFFTAKRVYDNEVVAGVYPTMHTINITQTLYNDNQRYFGYNPGTLASSAQKEYKSEERNLYIHAVDPNGRVVDFDAGSGGKVTIDDNATHSGHNLNITIPSGYGYINGTYKFIVTMIHENISPRTKTLRKANTVGFAPDLATVGYNLSNGQVLIQNSSGNNALGEISIGQTDGMNPPSFVPQTLGVTDVLVQSVKILDTMDIDTVPLDADVVALALGNTVYFDNATANVVTGNFIVDTGQRNHIYDHASVKLRPGKNLPQGQCLVLFDRFEHDNSDVRSETPSYFSVDSYQHTEDLNLTGVTGAFDVGDVIEGAVSGVRGKIFDMNSANTFRVVNLDPAGQNVHFSAGETISINTFSDGVGSVKASGTIDIIKELEITYKNIPKYIGTSRTYNLRDSIDYRPSRADGDFKANYTVKNVAIPLDCTAFDLSTSFDVMPRYKLDSYAGRIDRVLLKKSREIEIQTGIPSLTPVPPIIAVEDGANPSMVLYNLFIPPYTFNVKPEGENAKGGVVVKSVKNKRYTMKEISQLDDRVRNLEYYVALNALEQNARDQDVRDSQGLTRFKNGILTDNFNSHSTVRRQVNETLELAQGFNDHSGYLQPKYALDKNMGHLWPAETIDTADWKFELNIPHSPNITTSGNDNEVISLDYDIIPWTTPDAPLQLMASESKETIQPADGPVQLDAKGEGNGKVNINPFSNYNFQGNLSLIPNFNDFIDINDTDNVIVTNLTGQADPLDGLPLDAIQTAQQDGYAQFLIPAQAVISETHGPLMGDPGTASGNPSVVTADSELSRDLNMSSTTTQFMDTNDHFHINAFDTPTAQQFTVELGATMQQAWAQLLHTPQITLQVFENAVVDVTVATHMTPQDIGVGATSMKPFQQIHAWFAGELVDNHMSAASVVHLSGENKLGKRPGSRAGQGKIQEWVSIQGEDPNSAKALFVGGRANVAYLTNITYAEGYAGTLFSDDGVPLVGNVTGQMVTTAQRSCGVSQVQELGQMSINSTGYAVYTDNNIESYDHRSGYFQAYTSSGSASGLTTVKLAQDAPSFSNALAAPASANLVELHEAASALPGNFAGDTDWLGSPVWGTEITIVRGHGQGKRGRIESYNQADKTAVVSGFGSYVGPGNDPDGVPDMESDFNPYPNNTVARSYYTLASTNPKTGGLGMADDRLKTNDHGEFYGTFHLPGQRFKTGTKILNLNDRGDNNPFLIKTWARAPYFSAGSIHTLSDSVVATRDIVDTEHAEGISYSVIPATDGANFLWATRQSDQTRGKVYVTTGITVIKRGSTFIMSEESDRTDYLTDVEVDGAKQNPDGSFTYTPTPVLSRGDDPAVPPTYGEWTDAYAKQIGIHGSTIGPKFRANRSGQRHTLWASGAATTGFGGDAAGLVWTPQHDTHYFPSIYPITKWGGGTVGGIKAFATVKNNQIHRCTITDHGAAVFNVDAGEVARGPYWQAAWDRNIPGTYGGAETFIGTTQLSDDAATIIENLPYVRAQMEAIENGTALSNYGSSGCGTAADPLAQSFTIAGQTEAEPNRHGVFLCGIDLWFAEKGINDVDVEIREMINGYPGQAPIPCMGGHSPALAVIPIEDINIRLGTNVPGTPGSGYPDANDPEAYTTAYFPAPVYLIPGRDYCFVVRCKESTDFFLWSSDSRGNILGSFDEGSPTSVDHAKGGSHYGGSLFLSQNAKTWEPDQYKDLMFRFRIANFTTSSGTVQLQAGTERLVHRLGTVEDPQPEAEMTPLAENRRVDYFQAQVEQRVPIGHNDQEGTITYSYNLPSDSDGNRGGDIPHTPGALTYLAESGRLEGGKTHDQGSFILKAEITANVGNRGITDPKVSPIMDLSRFKLTTWKNHINNGGISKENVVFASGVGTGFNPGDQFRIVPFDANNHLEADIGKLQVESNNSLGGIQSMNVYPTEASIAGRRYHQTPTLVSESTTGSLEFPETDIRIIGETNHKGGNCNFRYITKPVKLKSGMDASDISVTLDVNKPLGSQIYVYYKIKHKDDPGAFDDKNWVLMKQTSPKDNRPTVLQNSWMAGNIPMMEHTYSTGSEDEITYTDSNGDQFIGFKFFAIKIVGVTDYFAQPPIVGNLRAIAVT